MCVCVCIYHLLRMDRIWHKVIFFLSRAYRFEFRIFLFSLVKETVYPTIYPISGGIHNFPKSISTMWNAISFVLDLNALPISYGDNHCTTGIYISWPTVVKGDPNAPLFNSLLHWGVDVGTTLDCSSSLLLIRTLYCCVKRVGIIIIFRVFGLTRLRIEPRSSGLLANTLTIYQYVCIKFTRIYDYVRHFDSKYFISFHEKKNYIVIL